MPHGILLIEDEATLARNIKRFLERHDYEVNLAASGGDGLAQFETTKPDLVLLDLNLPDAGGASVLEQLRRHDPQVRVIIITAHGSVQVAVDAMKAGACDYLSKPLVLSHLKHVIDKTVGEERLAGALSYYRDKEASASGLGKIIGSSAPMRALKERIERLLEAERRLSDGEPPAVLITGETGTGKELVARALHFDGCRRDQPFIETNCAAIPAHLVESELFGYERGAFTDARERKLGLVEAAHGGTLFLDEIGDLDPATQVKLLKLLEDKSVRRLGSVRDHRVDIRIVTATHRSLEELVRSGRFRADLYYRLRVVTLALPPLRQRGDDILDLARHYLDLHARRYGRPELRFCLAAEAALHQHAWPGNVRELRNVVEQAVLTTSGPMVMPEHLSLPAGDLVQELTGAGDRDGAGTDPTTLARLEDVERGLIARALLQSGGNVTRAAEALGISRDTLRYRIDKYKVAVRA